MVKKRRIKRTRAAHFGDDPKIRHSHGEHKRYAKSEPWERAYQKQKRKLKSALKK